jgi:hypothetical protein
VTLFSFPWVEGGGFGVGAVSFVVWQLVIAVFFSAVVVVVTD